MLAGMGRNWITHTFLVGMENSTATLGGSLTASYKTKHANVIELSDCTCGRLCQRNENLRSHQKPYTNVHRNLIHNSQKMGTTQMSFSRRTLNPLWCTHTMDGLSAIGGNKP